MTVSKRIQVCHFASVHTTTDTRVFERECVSLSNDYDVTLIAIGGHSGIFKNVRVIGIPKPKNRIRRLLFTTWKVFTLAWKQRADIYHIHDIELVPFALLLKLFGKQVIYDIHENTVGDLQNKKWITNSVRGSLVVLVRFLERNLAGKFLNIILVIARSSFASQFGMNRFTVIQNFAPLKQFEAFRVTKRSTLPNNLFYIGTIFDTYYDIIPIIKALHHCKQQGLEIHFHCVGYKGTYVAEQIETLPEYESIKHLLHFYGYLSQQEGYAISKNCKAGLCLKNQPEQILVSHERKFFEYMAAGLPMITCDSHIYRDVIDAYHVGKYANLKDVQAIAQVLTELMTSGELLDHLSLNGIKAAQHQYNWESQETILLELYQRLGSHVSKS